MTDKEKLLRRIQICNFSIQEAVLYLDTHPKNKKALEYYNKYRLLRAEVMAQYEKTYGPLDVYGNLNEESWKWIDSPWPWEMEKGE